MGVHWLVKGRTYRGDITELILLAGENLPEDTPHDLAAAGLGEIGHDVHGLGRREGPDAPADLEDELLAERVRGLVAVLDGNKGVDGLARELVRHTNDGSLGDGGVLNQGSLDFGSRQTVTADVHNIIDTAADPVEAFVVTPSTVTSELRTPR